MPAAAAMVFVMAAVAVVDLPIVLGVMWVMMASITSMMMTAVDSCLYQALKESVDEAEFGRATGLVQLVNSLSMVVGGSIGVHLALTTELVGLITPAILYLLALVWLLFKRPSIDLELQVQEKQHKSRPKFMYYVKMSPFAIATVAYVSLYVALPISVKEMYGSNSLPSWAILLLGFSNLFGLIELKREDESKEKRSKKAVEGAYLLLTVGAILLATGAFFGPSFAFLFMVGVALVGFAQGKTKNRLRKQMKMLAKGELVAFSAAFNTAQEAGWLIGPLVISIGDLLGQEAMWGATAVIAAVAVIMSRLIRW